MFNKFVYAFSYLLPLKEVRNSLEIPPFEKRAVGNLPIVQSKYRQVIIFFEPDTNAYYQILIKFIKRLLKKGFLPKIRAYSKQPVSFWEYVLYQPYIYVFPINLIQTYKRKELFTLKTRGNNDNVWIRKYSLYVQYLISEDISTKAQLSIINSRDEQFWDFFNNDIIIPIIQEEIKQDESGIDIYPLIKEVYQRTNMSSVLIIQNCFLFLEVNREDLNV